MLALLNNCLMGDIVQAPSNVVVVYASIGVYGRIPYKFQAILLNQPRVTDGARS